LTPEERKQKLHEKKIKQEEKRPRRSGQERKKMGGGGGGGAGTLKNKEKTHGAWVGQNKEEKRHRTTPKKREDGKFGWVKRHAAQSLLIWKERKATSWCARWMRKTEREERRISTV